MVNCVKSGTEVEEDEDGEEAIVSGHENIIGDFYKSCFCAV